MNIDKVLHEHFEVLDNLTKQFETLRAICVAEGDMKNEWLARDVYLVLLFAKRLVIRELVAPEALAEIKHHGV